MSMLGNAVLKRYLALCSDLPSHPGRTEPHVEGWWLVRWLALRVAILSLGLVCGLVQVEKSWEADY